MNGLYLRIVAGIHASVINRIFKKTRIQVRLATTIRKYLNNRTIRPGLISLSPIWLSIIDYQNNSVSSSLILTRPMLEDFYYDVHVCLIEVVLWVLFQPITTILEVEGLCSNPCSQEHVWNKAFVTFVSTKWCMCCNSSSVIWINDSPSWYWLANTGRRNQWHVMELC